MASSSTMSGASDNIDITGVSVAVEWTTPHGQLCHLLPSEPGSSETGHITFDCHFRPSLNTASLRLRAPILLKGLGRKVAPLFLFISPERIQSLVYHDVEHKAVSESVRGALGGGEVASLQVTLKQPADLVIPPHSPLVPKKKIFWDTLDSLKMLAQGTQFVMYLRRDQLPSEDQLALFSQAVSGGNLVTSIAHADISRLYDGKGGKLLEGEGLAIPPSGPVESPPSYDELGPSPPAPPIEKERSQSPSKEASAGSSRKRRRTSSHGEDSATDGVARADPSADTGHVEAICRKLIEEMNARWQEQGDELRSELRQMETRMKDWVDERLNKHVTDLRQEIQQMSVQQQNQVHDQVQEVMLEVQEVREEDQVTSEKIEEVREEVQVIRDETADLVDGRLDERLDVLRGELEEYVTDQLHEVEGRVIDRLRSNVFIDFNIYD